MGEREKENRKSGSDDSSWWTTGRILLVLALVALAVPLLADSSDNEVFVEEGAVMDAYDGPLVEFGEDTETDLSEPFPDSETVRIGGTNITGHPAHHVVIFDVDEEWEVFDLDPEETGDVGVARDEGALSVAVAGGGVDVLEVRDEASPVDGEPDINIDRGTGDGLTTLIVGDLPADVEVSLIKDGEAADTATTDEDGEATFTLDYEGSALLGFETEDGARLENPSPTEGDHDSPITLSVDVDAFTAGTTGEVVFYGDGEELASESFEGDETVTTDWSLDAGETDHVNVWHAEAIVDGEVVDETDEFALNTNGPELSLPFPSDGSTYDPGMTADNGFSITVDDPDFDGWAGSEVAVRLFAEGDELVATTIDEETVVNTSAILAVSDPILGENDWSVVVEDDYGNEVIANYTYELNVSIDFRDVHEPTELLDDITVSAEIIERTDDPLIEEYEVSDGQLYLDDVPIDEAILIEARSGEYHNRTVVLPSLVGETNVFLLNDTVDVSTVAFNLEDVEGFFERGSTEIHVQRPVDDPDGGETRQFRTVAGDVVGPGGVVLTLERDQRYRITVTDRDSGETQVVGPFRPTLDTESVDVQPRAPRIETVDDRRTWWVDSSIDNNTVEIRYVDYEDRTGLVSVTIHERGNVSNILAEETFTHNLSATYEIPDDELHKEWVVSWEITRDDATHTPTETLSDVRSAVPGGLSDTHLQIAGIGILLLTAAVFSVLNVAVGAVVVSLSGGVLWWLGWLGGATTGAAVVIAIAVAAVYYIGRGGGVR